MIIPEKVRRAVNILRWATSIMSGCLLAIGCISGLQNDDWNWVVFLFIAIGLGGAGAVWTSAALMTQAELEELPRS